MPPDEYVQEQSSKRNRLRFMCRIHFFAPNPSCQHSIFKTRLEYKLLDKYISPQVGLLLSITLFLEDCHGPISFRSFKVPHHELMALLFCSYATSGTTSGTTILQFWHSWYSGTTSDTSILQFWHSWHYFWHYNSAVLALLVLLLTLLFCSSGTTSDTTIL